MRVDLSGIENSKLETLTIRYSYQNSENLDLLVQAGGAGGVDCALYSKAENELVMIILWMMNLLLKITNKFNVE